VKIAVLCCAMMIASGAGDVLNSTNSFRWIPSLRSAIAGDVVFNGVHVWLADSTPESRRAWHDSLQLLA